MTGRSMADVPRLQIDGARDEEPIRQDRLNAFSDGVFAVIITILVLELRPPKEARFAELFELWPTAVSYAISYLFIAIVWVNHHLLLRFAESATHRLIWGNFAHLFAVSLMPFSTAWIAGSRLGAVPVAFYAGVFVLVNATYLLLYGEAVDRSAPQGYGPCALDDAHAIAGDVGGLCRRSSRRPSLSDRRHRDDLPLPHPLPKPGGTGHHT